MVSQSHTDVIICGCGPTGAMLAAQLGQMNVKCIVLERESDITTDPRGIALDEDGIRIAQSVGVYDKLYSEIGSSLGKFLFVGGETHDLMHPPFTTMDYTTTEGGTGHIGFILHKQPILEKYIRNSMLKHSSVDFRPSSTVNRISEDDENVYVSYQDKDGEEHKISGKFLVAADGKTGFTRKNYLEPKGVILAHSSTPYEATWVAINLKLSVPTPQTHPDFPLWSKGYTPEQVYDLFFPKEFRMLCNPNHPAICSRFGLPEDKLWRFEFIVGDDQDPNEMSRLENMMKIVYPYLTHPRSKYGLGSGEIGYPLDCIDVLRCRPFTFSARQCNKWAVNRTILVGDSAHCFPPFGGQGIVSGFRDASSLAWRLAIATRPNYKFDESLLTAWYEERKQQLQNSLRATVENGDLVTETNRFKMFVRDWTYWAMRLIPSVRRWLEQGQRRYGMTRYTHQPGFAFLPGADNGIFLPQVYCLPLSKPGQTISFSDDIIFAHEKKSLFQIVSFVNGVDNIPRASQALSEVESLSQGELSVSEATYIVLNTKENSISNHSSYVCRIATGNEFADSELCVGRPEPQYYDENRIARDVHYKKYLIIRHDRLVYAACDSKEELNTAAQSIAKLCGHEKN